MVSDIVCENFSPRVRERLGLNYDDYVKLKPDIIWVDQPMQGSIGPHKYAPGFGALITPLGGLSYLSGFAHRPPVGTGTNYTDYVINPGHLAIPIIAALRQRQRTGKGRHIVMSQYASAASVLETAILDYTVNDRIQPRDGNRVSYAAPHGCYRCRGEDRECIFTSSLGPVTMKKDDRWCAIAVFNNDEWEALCNAIGNPSLAGDDRFSTLSARKKNEDELDQIIQQWTAERSADEVMMLMQKAGVPAGVVQDAEDILIHDAHLRERGYYVYLDHPITGRSAYDGIAYKLSDTPGRPTRAAPCIGEHTEYICREILGMTEEQFDEYLVEGTIEIG